MQEQFEFIQVILPQVELQGPTELELIIMALATPTKLAAIVKQVLNLVRSKLFKEEPIKELQQIWLHLEYELK
jgi:hypothetical protein